METSLNYYENSAFSLFISLYGFRIILDKKTYAKKKDYKSREINKRTLYNYNSLRNKKDSYKKPNYFFIAFLSYNLSPN